MFVGNRVTKIQSSLPREVWQHVGTLENPADNGTRCSEPFELKDCIMWWSGPLWLGQVKLFFPVQPAVLVSWAGKEEGTTSLIRVCVQLRRVRC